MSEELRKEFELIHRAEEFTRSASGDYTPLRLQREFESFIQGAEAAAAAKQAEFNKILAQEVSDADELLKLLNLDPAIYRTECGYVNLLKIKAALKNPNDYPTLATKPSEIDELHKQLAMLREFVTNCSKYAGHVLSGNCVSEDALKIISSSASTWFDEQIAAAKAGLQIENIELKKKVADYNAMMAYFQRLSNGGKS